ncbi:MAG: hypothetical protein EOP53_06660 [Sphingobacteriales bacterium]|nr:MAG: hypothetical protein EOP53_06660 [Sphingobacteriales bacterium]
MKGTFNSAIIFICCTLFFSCKQNEQAKPFDATENKKQIASMLDSFNVAAANADFNKYFNFYTEDATFNGTDATENWDKKAFMAWAKPFFDKKTTWNFTALKRNIYFGKQADIAWFEELLNTQMKICRGSGVVVKENNEWKVQQYVLSTTVPNSILDSVISLKSKEEAAIMQKLSAP